MSGKTGPCSPKNTPLGYNERHVEKGSLLGVSRRRNSIARKARTGSGVDIHHFIPSSPPPTTLACQRPRLGQHVACLRPS